MRQVVLGHIHTKWQIQCVFARTGKCLPFIFGFCAENEKLCWSLLRVKCVNLHARHSTTCGPDCSNTSRMQSAWMRFRMYVCSLAWWHTIHSTDIPYNICNRFKVALAAMKTKCPSNHQHIHIHIIHTAENTRVSGWHTHSHSHRPNVCI